MKEKTHRMTRSFKRPKLMGTCKGFTLIEIMIVVAIIGILVAVAIPGLIRTRINANEGAVKSDMRTFSSANEAFRAVQTPPTYAPDIATLTGASPQYIDITWNTMPKQGFTFTYTPAAAPGNTYGLLAVPLPSQGTTTYCVDQTGIIVGGTAGVAGPATGCTGGLPISG